MEFRDKFSPFVTLPFNLRARLFGINFLIELTVSKFVPNKVRWKIAGNEIICLSKASKREVDTVDSSENYF